MEFRLLGDLALSVVNDVPFCFTVCQLPDRMIIVVLLV